MSPGEKEMNEYMENFKEMPDRLLKYNEILLEGEHASPESYQETMSYRRLAIALTTRCNLTCTWCYRLDSEYKRILDKDLDLEKFKKFIQNTEGKFRMVHLGGLGEPTMYPEIIKVIQLAKKLSSNVKITSNGVLLNSETISQYIDAGLTHIEISIDAFDKEKHDEFRGNNLDHLIDVVCYISNKTTLHLQINSIISSMNYKWLTNFVSVFKNAKNIKIWHTILPFLTDQARNEGVEHISLDEYQNLLSKIEREIIKEGLKWELYPSSSGVRLDPVIEMKRKRNICFTCFEDPYIGVTGKFLFCPRQEYAPVVDISDGFEKSWNHPSLLKFRQNMLKGRFPLCCSKLCSLKPK